MKSYRLNLSIFLLTCLGLFVAGNLSLSHLLHIVLPCGPGGGCERVLIDSWSQAGGVPVAYFGFLAYAALAAVTFVRMLKPTPNKNLVLIPYLVSLLGTLASAALTYHSIFEIHALCKWCVTSAITMTVIFVLHALLLADKSSEPAPKAKHLGAMIGALGVAFLGIGVMAVMLKKDASAGITADVNRVSTPKIAPADAHYMLGDSTSKVTLIEFGDLMCPSCKAHFPEIVALVRNANGKIKFAFRHFPLRGLPGHEYSQLAAVVSEMAAEDGRFYDFLTAIYSQKEEAKSADEIFTSYGAIGGNVEKAQARFADADAIQKDPAFKHVMKDSLDATDCGLHSTPTFFIIQGDSKPEVKSFEQVQQWFNEHKTELGMG